MSVPLTYLALVNYRRHRNTPAVYEAVLLGVIHIGSAFMARFGTSRLHEHESSGGSLNRSMRRLFMAVSITNEIIGPTACMGIGALIILLIHREAELRIRIIIMLVSELLCLESMC